MAVCGSCGGARRICTCVIAPDGSTTTVIGNGNLTSPFAFNKIEGPTPRPIADIAKSDGSGSQAITINTQTLIAFNLDQMERDGVHFGDPSMVDLAQNRIVFTTAGKYFVGGYLFVQDLTSVGGNNRVDVYLSQGIPAGANVYSSESQIRSAQNPNTVDQILCPFGFVEVTAGQYMEMYVFSTITDATEPGASAYMYAIWMDE